jgi:hypothetical protein
MGRTSVEEAVELALHGLRDGRGPAHDHDLDDLLRACCEDVADLGREVEGLGMYQ